MRRRLIALSGATFLWLASAGAGPALAQSRELDPTERAAASNVVVELALLWYEEAFGDPVSPEVDAVASQVDLRAFVDSPDSAMEIVDARGPKLLGALQAGGVKVSPEVQQALASLSGADNDRFYNEEDLQIRPAVYLDALDDILQRHGAGPTDGDRQINVAELAAFAKSVDVGQVVGDVPPTPDGGPPRTRAHTGERASPSATAAPGGSGAQGSSSATTPAAAAPTTAAPAAASSGGSSGNTMLLVAIGAVVLGVLVTGGFIALVLRRRPPAVPVVATPGTTTTGPTEPGPGVGSSGSVDLVASAERLTRAGNLADLHLVAVDEAVQLLHGESGALVVVGDDGLSLACESSPVMMVPERLADGVLRRAADTGQPVAVVSQTEPAVANLPKSLAVIPIITLGQVRAMVIVLRGDAQPFTSAEIEVGSRLAPVVGAALETFGKLDSMETLALVDSLTSLGNRRRFDRDLEPLLQAAIREQRPLSLLMVDIDFFKAYNDQHGHPAGDAVLRHVGTALTSSLRPADAAYRFGGDEFCVLLPDTDHDTAATVADRLRRAVTEVVDDDTLPVTVSIGLATAAGGTAAGLQERADRALYAAKERGRDQAVAAATGLDD